MRRKPESWLRAACRHQIRVPVAAPPFQTPTPPAQGLVRLVVSRGTQAQGFSGARECLGREWGQPPAAGSRQGARRSLCCWWAQRDRHKPCTSALLLTGKPSAAWQRQGLALPVACKQGPGQLPGQWSDGTCCPLLGPPLLPFHAKAATAVTARPITTCCNSLLLHWLFRLLPPNQHHIPNLGETMVPSFTHLLALLPGRMLC